MVGSLVPPPSTRADRGVQFTRTSPQPPTGLLRFPPQLGAGRAEEGKFVRRDDACRGFPRGAGTSRGTCATFPSGGAAGAGRSNLALSLCAGPGGQRENQRKFWVPNREGFGVFFPLLLSDVSVSPWKASSLCFTGKRLTQQPWGPGCTIEVIPYLL